MSEPTKAQLERALKLINVGMMAEARRRQWCGDYEEWATTMNEKIGFEVFGRRLVRKRVAWNLEVMFRGAAEDMETMLYEFTTYLQQYEPDSGIEARVQITYTDQNTIDEPMNDDEDADAPAEMLPGYVPNGCNCEECRLTRLRAPRR